MEKTPGFKVCLNGRELVTVSAEGRNMLHVRVNGVRANAEFAWLDVAGGWYGGDGPSSHLLWEADRLIQPGDEIEVTFLEDASTSRPGKTIEELYSENEEKVGPPPSVEQILAQRALEPLLRDGYVLSLTPPNGEAIIAQTEPEEFDFGLSVHWVWMYPERATVYLSSSSLDKVARREPGRRHARFYISSGERVVFRASLP